jgi:hypothetical protein
MNKKRKILTVVALALFGAIILFHYGSIDYDGGHKGIEYMTAAEKATAIKKGTKVTPMPLTAEDHRDKYHDLLEFLAADPTLQRVTVEYPGKGLYLSKYPGVGDIRMPLFVLGVFYVGLFSILGNKKRDNSIHQLGQIQTSRPPTLMAARYRPLCSSIIPLPKCRRIRHNSR